MRYSFERLAPIQASGLPSSRVHIQCRNFSPTPKRSRPRGRAAARAWQGQPHHQRALCAGGRRPLDQADLLFRADAGKTEARKSDRAALHRSGDRPPVRRLSRSDYAGALHAGALPPNIKVIEFFSSWRAAGCTFRSRSNITFPQTTRTQRPISWRAGSTSSPSLWPSALPTALRAIA
jgi:hypothetical protein